MSTGLNCDIVQKSTNEWFYILEDWDAPKQSWDWREFATAYGPFPDLEQAKKHLRENQTNPGGHNISALPEGVTELDLTNKDVLRDLFEKAQNPNSEPSRFSYRTY